MMGFFFLTQNFMTLLPFLYMILVISPSLALEASNLHTKPTAYEVLRDYDFPIGILPEGVVDYDLEPSTGKFSVYFNGSCGFSLDGFYDLNYESIIKGYISHGKLSSLEGVTVKLFLFWVGIGEVRRTEDALQFTVGFVGANFPLESFEECPQCGCGIKCGYEPLRKLKMNPFVYLL